VVGLGINGAAPLGPATRVLVQLLYFMTDLVSSL
jgi:hypothetical protein